MGFGSDAWDRLFGQPRPSTPTFQEIKGRLSCRFDARVTFHIRATRMDIRFASATQIMSRPGSVMPPARLTKCMASNISMDLIGFVDGMKLKILWDQAALEAAIIGGEDQSLPAEAT